MHAKKIYSIQIYIQKQNNLGEDGGQTGVLAQAMSKSFFSCLVNTSALFLSLVLRTTTICDGYLIVYISLELDVVVSSV